VRIVTIDLPKEIIKHPYQSTNQWACVTSLGSHCQFVPIRWWSLEVCDEQIEYAGLLPDSRVQQQSFILGVGDAECGKGDRDLSFSLKAVCNLTRLPRWTPPHLL
jgi:hypothetical protein